MYNDFGALAALRLDARQDADAALETVASQFESLFLQMMLKSMREAVPDGGLFNSNDMQTYRGMADQQLAVDLSAQGGIGLADVLVRQLQGGTVSAAGRTKARQARQRAKGLSHPPQTPPRGWRSRPPAGSVSSPGACCRSLAPRMRQPAD